LVRTEVGLVKYVAGTVEIRLSRNISGEPVLTVTCPRGSAEVSYANFTKDAAILRRSCAVGIFRLRRTRSPAAPRSSQAMSLQPSQGRRRMLPPPSKL
jgi:hypothetical protein